ncbi:MAG: hypothetical protein ACYDH9_21290, partial [Limisphaerales bacterium]
MHTKNIPFGFRLACRRQHIRPTRFVLVVSVADQALSLYGRVSGRRDPFLRTPAPFQPMGQSATRRHGATIARTTDRGSRTAVVTEWCYALIRRCRCSTSRFGVGQLANSNCTPLGLHRIAEKIGGGWPIGAVFRSRKLIGFTWQGQPRAPIAHRILWLDGLEPGFNRGGRVDTHRRYVYIHGIGDEPTLGHPASGGG